MMAFFPENINPFFSCVQGVELYGSVWSESQVSIKTDNHKNIFIVESNKEMVAFSIPINNEGVRAYLRDTCEVRECSAVDSECL